MVGSPPPRAAALDNVCAIHYSIHRVAALFMQSLSDSPLLIVPSGRRLATDGHAGALGGQIKTPQVLITLRGFCGDVCEKLL